jgi:putative flippase GtrA
MTAEADFAPQAVIAALNRAHVRYVIVGGLAVAAHGVVRATHDLDLVPDPDASNAAALCDR